jgi:uncharacterized protein YdeI (YjbR/CyaY-like superfamily)
MNLKVDWFFEKPTNWQNAFVELRELILETELIEDLKWGCPCYTLNNNNVILIHGFKNYCALLLMQGALIKDTKNVLVQQTENVQSARQMRFTSNEDVIKNKALIKSYIKQAIAISKAGLKVELKKTTEYKMQDSFKTALDNMPDLKIAFESLTPGRQRGYLLYFSAAKQLKTIESRIEKCMPIILAGKGIDD